MAKLYLQSHRFTEAVDSANACVSVEEQPDYKQKGRMPSYMGPYFSEVERMCAPCLRDQSQGRIRLGQKRGGKLRC